jgi:hypothetical protein
MTSRIEPDTNTAGEEAGTVRAGADDVPAQTIPPRPPRDQGSSARRRRQGRLRVLAAAGLVVAAVPATVIALHTQRAAPSPLSAVLTALARTSAQNYTFTIDSTVRHAGHQWYADVVSGTFDPRDDLGTELLTTRSAGQTQHAQVRFIGAYLYTSVPSGTGFAKPWDKSPLAGAAGQIPPGDLYAFTSDQPVRPSELAPVLRSAGAQVRDAGPASGPGWTGIRYAFTARLYHGSESVSGTAFIDQQGRVRRLMTITTQNAGDGRPAKVPGVTTARVLTFSDFGAPVLVTAPPASKVKYTSGEPYQGFYF